MIGPSTVSLFYALLAIVANLTVVAILVIALSGRMEVLQDVIAPTALTGALVVAVLATAGSLYFSEVAHFEPCTLCWYQRIAMYPLVVLLGVAAWRRDTAVRHYVVPLAGAGAAISVYHYAIEWGLLTTGACSATVPCNLVWFRELGFISLPYLALSAFLLIVALVWVAGRGDRDEVRAA